MRKEWKQPVLEVLDVKLTMQGEPDVVDDYQEAGGDDPVMGPS